MNIGEPVRRFVIEPLEAPAHVPDREHLPPVTPEPEPNVPEREPVLVP